MIRIYSSFWDYERVDDSRGYTEYGLQNISNFKRANEWNERKIDSDEGNDDDDDDWLYGHWSYYQNFPIEIFSLSENGVKQSSLKMVFTLKKKAKIIAAYFLRIYIQQTRGIRRKGRKVYDESPLKL